MTDIYDRARASAIRMLALRPAGKGAVFTLRRMVDANPDDPDSVPTPQDYTGSAVRVSYTHKDINGTTVMVGDVRFIVSPVLADGTSMPAMVTGDRLLFDGTMYTVVGPDLLDFAGLTVALKVQARRA